MLAHAHRAEFLVPSRDGVPDAAWHFFLGGPGWTRHQKPRFFTSYLFGHELVNAGWSSERTDAAEYANRGLGSGGGKLVSVGLNIWAHPHFPTRFLVLAWRNNDAISIGRNWMIRAGPSRSRSFGGAREPPRLAKKVKKALTKKRIRHEERSDKTDKEKRRRKRRFSFVAQQDPPGVIRQPKQQKLHVLVAAAQTRTKSHTHTTHTPGDVRPGCMTLRGPLPSPAVTYLCGPESS